MAFGRRNFTEDEILRKLPAYAPKEDGSGYFFENDAGLIMVTGALANDQLFEKDGLGTINVSRALEYLHQTGAQIHTVGIDDGLKENISLIEINAEYVRKLRAAQLKEPVLLVLSDDGVQVLDGHHRLSRMILDRKKDYPALMLPPDGLAMFQVRHWAPHPEHKWILASGTDPKYIAQKVARAKQRWSKQSFVKSVSPL